ncbi:toxin-antitoxin system YwqK family antitoxin [uncultured Aquimarina sp.]|uniref:toxin-antitoxin system YwqK family antitoxin n=1 Tax=uncultured Aquimarina sp. TaxID=575652 RepID=UPI002620B145|nr:toxin-antitoxin system YwqK family antitoxin [uncultured Aquimarina sp.]
MKNILFKLLFLVSFIFFSKVNSQELALLTDKTKDSSSINTRTPKSNQKVFYYPNGSIKEVRETANNKLNGSWKFFYANGQLKKEGNFLNDKTHGLWKIYYSNGALLFIEHYKNGKESGIWKAFHPDGKINIEGEFIKGKRQGQWKVYNELGALERIVTFENDIEKSELVLDHKSTDLNFFSVNQSIGNY